MNESLDRFLSGTAGQAAAAEPPVAAAEPSGEPAVVEAAPEPAAAPEPGPAAPAAEAADDDEDAPPASSNGTVPVHVLQAERNKRNDWKSQAVRNAAEKKAAEERLAALQAQLEELKKAPPAAPAVPPATLAAPMPVAPPPAPEPMPNPAEDPQGYAAWISNQQARQAEQQALVAFNLRLETTEDLLREKEGDEAVDKALAAFKSMVGAEEQAFGKGRSPLAQALTIQRNPYRWMYQQTKKAEADKEIGGDLTGYKAKIEAELRAKIEAEFAEKAAAAAAGAPIAVASVPARSAPQVVLPRSLANAPSSAPRNAAAWTGPTPLAELVPRR